MSKSSEEIDSDKQPKFELPFCEIKVEAIIKQEPSYPEDIKIDPEEYIQNYHQLQNEQIEHLNTLDDVVCNKDLVTVKLEDVWSRVGCDREVDEYNLQNVTRHRSQINKEGFDSGSVTIEKYIQVNLMTHSHSRDLQLSGSKNSDRSLWFKCNFCKFRARSIEYIKRHKYIHHTDSNVYECRYCQFETKHQFYLSQHLRTRHKKWHFCRDCKYKTIHDVAFTEHNKKHESFMCVLCDFKTGQKYCLDLHMKATHNAWYVRNLDNKQKVIPDDESRSDGFELKTENMETDTRFVKDQNDVNISNNHEVMSYQCKLCAFRTPYKELLKYHVEQRHSTKFHCALCGYETGTKSKLELHLKVDHYLDMEWFHCHHCDSKIKGKCNLVDHLKNAHKI